MVPNYPHTALIITGVLHVVLGAAIFIPTCIGLKNNEIVSNSFGFSNGMFGRSFVTHRNPDIDALLGVVLASSIWIIMNGFWGISAGVRREDYRRTNCLKITYMVLSILSALSFSWPGAIIQGIVVQGSVIQLGLSYSIRVLVTSCSIADFILSIVSASICCCCATSVNSVGHVQATQGNNAISSFSNKTFYPGSYPPGNLPPGAYPPGNYPPGAYPPGNYPPGAYPPGNYPPGAYPPGNYPPGAYPPGNYPTGQNPPPAYPPGNLPPGAYPPGNNPPGNQASKDLQAPESDSINPV